jgi:hypothetical protein
MLVFNRFDTYTFDGAISGPGQVVQFGTGKTVLTQRARTPVRPQFSVAP